MPNGAGTGLCSTNGAPIGFTMARGASVGDSAVNSGVARTPTNDGRGPKFGGPASWVGSPSRSSKAPRPKAAGAAGAVTWMRLVPLSFRTGKSGPSHVPMFAGFRAGGSSLTCAADMTGGSTRAPSRNAQSPSRRASSLAGSASGPSSAADWTPETTFPVVSCDSNRSHVSRTRRRLPLIRA
jgi:hypothetical protein